MAENIDEKIHPISNTYAVGSDAYNVILYEKFNKMDSRGKSAKPTGETGWRPAKCGAYFSSIEYLGENLKEKAEKEAIGEVGVEFEKIKEYMDEWKADLKAYLNEHITLELAKVKDLSKKEEA